MSLPGMRSCFLNVAPTPEYLGLWSPTHLPVCFLLPGLRLGHLIMQKIGTEYLYVPGTPESKDSTVNKTKSVPVELTFLVKRSTIIK